ncbi:MAG: hypothetical protein WDO15_22710 [Bacteroidota bacterium]
MEGEEHGSGDTPEQVAEVECNEQSWDDSTSMYYAHDRCWTEYLNNTGYSSEYAVSYQEISDAEGNRNNIVVENWTDDPDYWRQVYAKLYLDNKDHLLAIQDSLLLIKEQRNLDRDGFCDHGCCFRPRHTLRVCDPGRMYGQRNGSVQWKCNAGTVFSRGIPWQNAWRLRYAHGGALYFAPEFWLRAVDHQ